ncbi:MAG: HD domain-containing protein [Candidatus Heimdallarchaeota archaeon]|nr:HD domain-containing protein [Candidatus Heimdallarchaeota archaeon]MCK4954655.1 HD domain-containing protein [Candidatus Heimdallarchaeota archaeon]
MRDVLNFVRTIRDPIYDEVRMTGIENKIIDTPIFQRLRWISQLSGVRQVYPSAIHSRFTHCVGTMHLAGRYTEEVYREDEDVIEKVQLARIAALLHDIGHGPFSHTYDDVVFKRVYPDAPHGHDVHRDKMVNSEYLKPIIEEFTNPENLMKIWNGENYIIHPLVQGALGADRLDFMLRDSFFAGTLHFGIIAVNRIINNTAIHKHLDKEAIHYNWKCLDDIYSSLIGRFFEYKNVYFHKTARAADITIHEMLKEACEPLNLIERTNDLSEYIYLNEYTLVGEIYSKESEELTKAKALVKDLFDRRLYKSVWERIIDESTAENLGITVEGLCKLTAEESFIKKVNQYCEENDIVLGNKMKIDSTYRLSTINEQEFQASNIYIYDPYDRIRPGSNSFTLNEALNTTTYITTFSGPRAYRSLFTLVRVYAHPDESKTITNIWNKIRPKVDSKEPDVSVTSY